MIEPTKPGITEQLIKDKIAAIDAVANDLPSVIIVHNLKHRSIEYMSERGLKQLKTTLPELKALGPAYFEKYFNPEDAKIYTPIALRMLEKNDPEEVFSFFQQVRGSEDEEWGWFLSSNKVLLCDEDGNPAYSITAAHPVDDLKSFTYKIERLLEEQEVMRSNLNRFTKLSKREKEIIKYLVEGLSSVAIAEKLFVSASTIEQHRKNIKAKLGIKTMPDLVKFAQVFNLI